MSRPAAASKLFQIFTVIITVFASLTPASMGVAQAQGEVGNIHAYPETNFIDVQGGDLSLEITLTVDDISNGDGVDFSETQMPIPNEADPSSGYVAFWITDFSLEPGDIITAGNGYESHTLVVTPRGSISKIEMHTGIIEGYLQPDSIADVYFAAGARRSATADSEGFWSVNFSQENLDSGDPMEQVVVDLVPNMEGTLFQRDDDGDRTGYDIFIDNKRFHAEILENNVGGYDWEIDSWVTLSIDDPANGEGVDFTDTRQVAVSPSNPDSTEVNFNDLGGLQLAPGMQVTMTDGVTVKYHEIANLQVIEVNVDEDTVLGNGTPGARLNIQYCDSSGCLWRRYTTVDDYGDWQVNFSIPGEEIDEQQILDILPGMRGEALEPDIDGDHTDIAWIAQGNPVIKAWTSENRVDGYEWVTDLPVTANIDDPSTPGLDYEETQTPFWDENTVTLVSFNPGDSYLLKPGDIITMTNGVITKTHEVTHVTISHADVETDIVTGTAWPDTNVGVCIHHNGCLWRWVTADAEGNWLADFADPGDGSQELFDLQPGTSMDAVQWEEDGDGTGYIYNIPVPSTPTIVVRANENRIEGYDWIADIAVQFSIDDPATPESPDFVLETVPYYPDWDPGRVYLDINLEYDIKPGDIITASNGSTSKQLVVSSLAFTSIDIDNDIVYGAAEPNQILNIWACNTGPCIHREITTGPDGIWAADFANPGDQDWETETIDLRNGTWIDSSIRDEDGDITVNGFSVPNPIIAARLTENEVHGYHWVIGSNITLTFGDPNNPDYTDTQVVGIADWDPNQTLVRFRLQDTGFTLQPGMLVTLTDGSITKTTTVGNLWITSVNPDTDIITGIADPGAEVHLGHLECNESGCFGFRRVFADANGDWLADFSIPGEDSDEQDVYDIRPGMGNEARQVDDDGDKTIVEWYLPNPTITVRIIENEVHANDWPFDVILTLSIDDPATPENPDYADSRATLPAEWNPSTTWTQFQLGQLQLQPGFEVTLTDGITTKAHVISAQHVTTIDLYASTVSGQADPWQEVWVDTWCTDCPTRRVNADETGLWTANFSEPGDEGWEDRTVDFWPGLSGESRIHDEDGDATSFTWTAPNYTMHAVPTYPEVHGHDWLPNTMVTLTIDDDADPLNGVLYTATMNTDDNPWCGSPCFDLKDIFTLEVGQYVTMSDGTTQKNVQVSTLQITTVDIINDTIAGIADPGSRVAVNIWSQNGLARYVTTGQDGTWVADFSVHGDEDFEQFTTDITYGDHGRAIQLNPDGSDDGTLEYWAIEDTNILFLEQFTFNFNNPILASPAIRYAIAYGTDRQRILNEAFLPSGEYGQVLNSLITPASPYAAPASQLVVFPYNPATAMTILESEGWEDTNGDGIREKDGQPLHFTFKTSLNPIRVIAAQIFQQNMTAIGIDITVVHEPNFFQEDGALITGNYDIAEFAWGSHQSGDDWLFNLYRSDNPQNYGYYANPNFDEAVDNFYASGTEQERSDAANIIQSIFSYELPAFYLFTRENITPYQTPIGTSVTLDPLPEVTITYTNVDGEGITTALAVNYNTTDLPEGSTLVGSVYEVGTSAMFEQATICLAYNDAGLTPEQENLVRLYHYEYGAWVDVTDPGYPDTTNKIVCGTVDSFSPFAVIIPMQVNQPPEITAVNTPLDPVQLGQFIQAAITFTDPDAGDTHTIFWDWGDGTTSQGSNPQETHFYSATGVYTIHVAVTDSHGETATAASQYIVIYDANGGFVTGGGWITSPVGAYTLDPGLTGKATFGFVSRYQKGAKIPSGNTEFQFKVANFTFKSSSYDWLVVAGSKAQFKGTGTINGSGAYGFMLTATDGSPDRFRIKIWDKLTGEVIYDNMPGQADDALPTTALGGGSIVIHK